MQVRKEVLCHKTGDACLGVGCSSFPALPLWEEVCPLNRPSFSAHKFKEPEGQVARWLEVLSEFDYTVVHRAGK